MCRSHVVNGDAYARIPSTGLTLPLTISRVENQT
jgi:hypothetical protein